jgi:hypothetical protein
LADSGGLWKRASKSSVFLPATPAISAYALNASTATHNATVPNRFISDYPFPLSWILFRPVSFNAIKVFLRIKTTPPHVYNSPFCEHCA